uniref:Uncharacterized protein n=1 Tax=Pseudomonas syringae pv. actinidiae TaxID=103796 RepID=A0A2P0QHH4_PSESF|nr:hypothetical protein [Pseudomonas syringae pv. actinidiae]
MEHNTIFDQQKQRFIARNLDPPRKKTHKIPAILYLAASKFV